MKLGILAGLISVVSVVPLSALTATPAQAADCEDVAVVGRWMTDNSTSLLTFDELGRMADEGHVNGIFVNETVRQAAGAIHDDRAFFENLETAGSGRPDQADGQMGPSDVRAITENCAASADCGDVAVIEKWMTDNGVTTLTYDEIGRMGNEGHVNGIFVDETVRQAARAIHSSPSYFDVVDTAGTGRPDQADGQIGPADTRAVTENCTGKEEEPAGRRTAG